MCISLHIATYVQSATVEAYVSSGVRNEGFTSAVPACHAALKSPVLPGRDPSLKNMTLVLDNTGVGRPLPHGLANREPYG